MPRLNEPVTEEEIASYIPVQKRPGLADALRDLQTFGFALVED
jgi:hypothetical protein